MKPATMASFDDEAMREEFKSRSRTLRNQVAAGHFEEACTAFIALDDWQRPIADADLHHLLLQNLSWDESQHHLAARLHIGASTLSELGRQTAMGAMQRLPKGHENAQESLARAITTWSRAAKLEHLAMVPKTQRQRFDELNRLFSLAENKEAIHYTRHLAIWGQQLEASIESLYVRALLLRRLSGGNLNAPQIEILDNWLVSWMPSMWVTSEPPDGEVALRVRLESNAGLTQGVVAVADDARYVCIAPLRQRLDETIASLHRGELFPGWGPAAEMRVEDHIVVLDSLQRELAQIEAGAATRRPVRNNAFGMVVDTHVGLANVLSGAFDPMHRGIRMRLQDHNESGVGFLADAADGARIQTGDLIAMHLDPKQSAVIGEIVRKRDSIGDEDIAVGVKLLSRENVALELSYEERSKQPQSKVQAIFFAGQDNSGRHDAIVVSETVFKSGKVMCTDDEGEAFRLCLNRARHRGRGWVIAGFEMLVEEVEAAPVSPVAKTRIGQGGGVAPVAEAVAPPPPKASGKFELELADWPEGRAK